MGYMSLLVVSGSTLPSTADESLHAYVEDGYTHSSIRDPHEILWYILLGPHHDRLATYHLSHREMEARDTYVSCVKPGKNSIFLKKGKTVILVENQKKK